MARQALGKGLSALIPNKLDHLDGGVLSGNGVQSSEIPLRDIKPNPHQPRLTFNPTKLKELADSISQQGIIQPITVRRAGAGYELISGERRLRAVQTLGWRNIPAIIKEKVREEEMAEWAIIENVQRDDLNAMEEAKAYKRLSEDFKLSQEEIAKKVGKDRATVANLLRLLKLPDEVQNLINAGKLDMGHARALLGIDRAEAQKTLAQRAVREGWSVRQVEAEVSKAPGAKSKPRPMQVTRKDADVLKAEEELCRAMATRVRIKSAKRGGTIEIEYYSLEELERLIEILKGKKR
jgi:ParB family chromosome partitioning protein